MRGSLCLLLLLTTWSVLISDTKADWFDDIVDGIHEKLVAGADYLKNSAAPAIREKFNEAKGTLQDPETHHKIKVWLETVGYHFRMLLLDYILLTSAYSNTRHRSTMD
ncbi:unnamed protein product [Anisakis simplex]|uniref:Secreted protein n=1 Tax=Anisakis simplex TaxID=6269 RepID=A0A0M3JD94_ANISI|nr:unnamed protein product [Anisakis simplex]